MALPQPYNAHHPPMADIRTFEYVPVGLLTIDVRIERSIRPGLVDRIASEFEWAKFEVLTICERGDGNGHLAYVVVEGQHRTLAAKRFGSDFEVPCMLVPEQPRTVEPRIAYDISTSRRSHSPHDRLKLLYHSEEPYAVAIVKTLGARGLQPGTSRSSRTISAVGTMQDIVRIARRSPEEGGQLLGQVVDAILTAWPADDPEHQGSRFDSQMLKGVSALIARNPHFEDDRLASTMRTRTPSAWVDRTTHEQPWVAIRASLVAIYNRNLRSDDRRLQ